MTGNFKCGMNNMLSRGIDPLDSRYPQGRADNGHHSLRHVSVPVFLHKPIREGRQFGCADTPVRDADWLVDYSVGPISVGEIRINYLRDPAGRGQSPDAAPSMDYFSSTQYVVSVIIVLQHTVLSVTRCGIIYVLKDFSYDFSSVPSYGWCGVSA